LGTNSLRARCLPFAVKSSKLVPALWIAEVSQGNTVEKAHDCLSPKPVA
jgi:hypothetical protein